MEFDLLDLIFAKAGAYTRFRFLFFYHEKRIHRFFYEKYKGSHGYLQLPLYLNDTMYCLLSFLLCSITI